MHIFKNSNNTEEKKNCHFPEVMVIPLWALFYAHAELSPPPPPPHVIKQILWVSFHVSACGSVLLILQAAWDLVLWVHYVLVMTLSVRGILRLFPTLPYFELHSGVTSLCVCFLHAHVSIP